MQRHDVFRACGIGHGDGFLRGGVRADPRIVGADGHECEIEGPRAAEACEMIRHRGVASEKNPPAAMFEDVAVVAAIGVGLQARAPMPHLESGHFQAAV